MLAFHTHLWIQIVSFDFYALNFIVPFLVFFLEMLLL